MEAWILFSILTISGNFIFQHTFGAPENSFTRRNSTVQTAKCDVKTYVDDRDPNGTNLRVAPDKNSAVLRRIKNDDVIVTVSGFSDGWFQISAAENTSGEKIFKGRGWIHSSLLGMQAARADARLYAQPKNGSRILMKLKSDESRIKLIACQNDWVKIETNGKIGWLSPGGQCGNPVTTCS